MDKQQPAKEIILKALQQAITVCDNCTPKPEGVRSNLQIALKAHKERKADALSEVRMAFNNYFENKIHITELYTFMTKLIDNF